MRCDPLDSSEMTSVVETNQPFVVELESFSGPLDLLLNLIRAQEIDIADIPVAKVADQFLASIDLLGLVPYEPFPDSDYGYIRTLNLVNLEVRTERGAIV